MLCAVTSASEYAALKARAAATRGLVVHFSASWCEPCASVRDALSQASTRYAGAVLFAEVDAEAHADDICAAEGVESVPYIAFFRTTRAGVQQTQSPRGDMTTDGTCASDTMAATATLERVADVVGAKLPVIEANLRSLYGSDGTSAGQRDSFATLDDYLAYLTSRPGIFVFLTGTPSRPRCGFTGKLCEMLHALQAPYTYFDVMSSDEVCEGLKRYSDWPTYPQVYVDGELLGGYDICKQMHAQQELKAALKL